MSNYPETILFGNQPIRTITMNGVTKLAGISSKATKRLNTPLFPVTPPWIRSETENAPERAKAGKNKALEPERAKTGKNKALEPERAMTKTEARFLAWLKANTDAATTLIIPQPTRFFRFANGDTYTPDFLVIEDRGDDLKNVTAWEVKGGYRGAGWEQGYERYKRAREQFGKYAAFRMATWDRCLLQWSIE